VENLALIEQASIQWLPGFNVLTGETGAGKSMVIDAMGLLLGGRAQQEYIRAGSEHCLVEGVFTEPWPKQVLLDLAEAGIDPEEDIVFSREIQRSAKSTCRINLRSVPLAFYKKIISQLVNIHGQMEHMNILEPWCQLALLDSYGGEKLAAAAAVTSEAYEKWFAAKTALAAFEKSQEELAAKSDFLAWQLREIEAAALLPGEDILLKQEQYRLENAASITQSLHAAQSALLESGKEGSPLERIWEAKCQVEKLARGDDSLDPLLQQLNAVYYDLEDASQQIRSCGQGVVDDPARLDEINHRLALIRDVCRKYGGSIEAVLAQGEEFRQELDQVENKEYYGRELAKNLKDTAELYERSSEDLRQLRQAAAYKLGEAITEELRELCMPQAVFSIVVQEGTPSPAGSDEAIFMICPNPGEGSKPVAKIASGGEMARIMLAVKVILAQMDQVPTLIFDEIDSGLGGIALSSVARKLAQVSLYSQTICVTHAPVVAAHADSHLLVVKNEEKGRTMTTVRRLDQEERVEELSRMLAGENITAATKAQAAELLRLNPQNN